MVNLMMLHAEYSGMLPSQYSKPYPHFVAQGIIFSYQYFIVL